MTQINKGKANSSGNYIKSYSKARAIFILNKGNRASCSSTTTGNWTKEMRHVPVEGGCYNFCKQAIKQTTLEEKCHTPS